MNTVNREGIILLYSGGIDSTVLLFRLVADGYQVYPMYINYGQITYNGEIKAIKQLLPEELFSRLLILDIADVKKVGLGSLVGDYPENLGSKNEWYSKEFFPNRNMILLALAASYGEKIKCKKIAIGVVGEDSYPDTSLHFIELMNRALLSSVPDIQIIAPYAGLSRNVVISDAIQLCISLEKTFSCNSLEDSHCLFCTSCLDREDTLNKLPPKSI